MSRFLLSFNYKVFYQKNANIRLITYWMMLFCFNFLLNFLYYKDNPYFWSELPFYFITYLLARHFVNLFIIPDYFFIEILVEYAPYLFLSFPVLRLYQDVGSHLGHNDTSIVNLFDLVFYLNFILIIITVILLSIQRYVLLKYYEGNKILLPKLTQSNSTTINLINEGVPLQPVDILGKGKSTMDTVIKSQLLRAHTSLKLANISLVLISFLVLVGGGVSIGSITGDEIEQIRDLETQRKKLTELNHSLKEIIATPNTRNLPDSNIVKLNNNINHLISENYDSDKTYTELLQNIEDNTDMRWPDITMRIVIAGLTLFLVQIFFNIYKFNQQLAFHLYTKAEIIELYKETESDKKDLRTGLLSKLDAGPAFGQGPTSPTDQVINIIDKAKGVG